MYILMGGWVTQVRDVEVGVGIRIGADTGTGTS